MLMRFLLIAIVLVFNSVAFSANNEKEKFLDAGKDEIVDLALPTSISFDITSDSNKNTSSGIFADIGIPNNYRLFIGASRSSSSDPGNTYKPGGGTLGFGSDPLDKWVYTVMLNTWGIPDEVSANSVSGSLKYISENWDLQITPRVRKIIGIFTTPTRTEFTVMNTSITLAYNYFFTKHWQLMMALEGDNYDARLQRLKNNIDLVTSLAPNFGTMTQSFLQSLLVIELSYHLKKWAFSLETQSGKTAISESNFVSSTLRVFYSFTKSISMEFSGGNTRDVADTYGTIRFYGVSGTYSF